MLTTEEADNSGGSRTIHKAAENGNLELLTKAVQRDASALEQRNAEGATPLALAVQGQQYSAMKWLVKLGADVNAQDGEGRTCLSIAAYQGWMDGVLYLLKHGSKHNICDKHGRTPLAASTHCRDVGTMTTLLMNISEEEINMSDNERMTALQWAAFHERPAHIQLLLSRGADVTAQDIDGKTALHWAAQNGCVLSCKLLLEYCQDLVNMTDCTGKTPAHLAAAAGKCDIIQELCRYDQFDIEALDKDDRSPLHWAAALGQADCVKTLLSMNSEWDAVDIDGGTPLQYAKQLGHSDCQKYLETISEIKIISSPTNNHEGFSENRSRNSLTSAISYIKNIFKTKSEDDYMSHTVDGDNTEAYAMEEFGTNIGKDTSDRLIVNTRSESQYELPANEGDLSKYEVVEHTDSHITISKQPVVNLSRCEKHLRDEPGSENVSIIKSELADIDNRMIAKERESSFSQVRSSKFHVRNIVSDRVDYAALPPPPSPRPGDLGPIRGPIPRRACRKQSSQCPSPTSLHDEFSETPNTPLSSRKRCEHLRCSSPEETTSSFLSPDICRPKQNTLAPLRMCLKNEPAYCKTAPPVMEDSVNNRNVLCIKKRDNDVTVNTRTLSSEVRHACSSPILIKSPVRKNTVERKILDKQINSLLS